MANLWVPPMAFVEFAIADPKTVELVKGAVRTPADSVPLTIHIS